MYKILIMNNWEYLLSLDLLQEPLVTTSVKSQQIKKYTKTEEQQQQQ